jgi:PAS domain S-box-containing protein
MSRGKGHAPAVPSRLVTNLRARLAVAEDTLRAIRDGEVDAVVVSGKKGDQVFTLEGAEHAYRVLIESMNEGAVTLAADKMILYANQCFAGMVKYPLEQVTGSSFRRFLSAEDEAALKPLIQRAGGVGTKIQVQLNAADGTQVPAQISIRALARNGSNHAAVGMVVTDMTAGRRTEELLRALSHRVVQVQEAERSRVAKELHDNVTQLLCAVHIHSQTLVEDLSTQGGALKAKAVKLRDMLGKTGKEVVRISNNLAPSVLKELGLVAVLRETRTEFTLRTGISVELACLPLTASLSDETQLALYRIVQEALRNIEKHSQALQVTLHLGQQAGIVRMAINDDGIGFDQVRAQTLRTELSGLGLHGMRERATYVGASLKIRSGRRGGTEVEVLIPVP